MKIKSSQAYHGIAGLLFCCIVALYILLLRVADNLVFPTVAILALSILVIRYWISVGRTLTMDPEGCTVQFLWFRRKYRWENLKIKQIVSCKNSLGYRDPYTAAAIFAEKKMKKPAWLKPAAYSMLIHPFSFFYVYFDPHSQYRKWDYKCPDIYVVDEEVFRLKMQEWGVKLQ